MKLSLSHDISNEAQLDTAPLPTASMVEGSNSGPQLPKRLSFFVAINVLFCALLTTLSLLETSATEHAPYYLALLFFLCSTPMLFTSRLNGSYSILLIFSPLYFLFYGLTDILSYFPQIGRHGSSRLGSMFTDGEIAILLGAASLIVGYVLVVSALDRTLSTQIRKDWALGTIITSGVSLWLLGLWATWTWQFQYVDTQVTTQINSSIGSGLVLLRMLQPVGATLLVYAYLKSRSKPLLVFLILVVIFEMMFGLVADSKELAIRTALIFLLAKWLVDGQLPYKLCFGFALVFVMVFPVFQAYRYEVLQVRANSREQALQNFTHSLALSLKSKAFGMENAAVKGLQGLSGRINLKANMELIVQKTGRAVPFQNGYTISLLSYALVPRFILPNKPDSSVGQLFNREFKVSLDRNTYISATHIGELYWNYGWIGLVIGMFLIGCLLATIGSSASMVDHKSITKLLILVTTIYLLCLRFEGGIALQYTLWIRSLILIALLHFLFRSRTAGMD